MEANVLGLRAGHDLGGFMTLYRLKIGRFSDRRTKAGNRLPEVLEGFVVTEMVGDALDKGAQGADGKKGQRNLRVANEVQKKLLERQHVIAPEEPPNLLRVIEVTLPPTDSISGILRSKFQCREQNGTSICRGDCREALWTGVEPPPFAGTAAQRLFQTNLWKVPCLGEDCPMHARVNAENYPVFPRCLLEWKLGVQFTHVRTTMTGVATFASKAPVGFEPTFANLKAIHDGTGGRLGGANVLLRYAKRRTRYMSDVPMVFIDLPKPIEEVIDDLAQSRTALGRAQRAAQLSPLLVTPRTFGEYGSVEEEEADGAVELPQSEQGLEVGDFGEQPAEAQAAAGEQAGADAPRTTGGPFDAVRDKAIDRCLGDVAAARKLVAKAWTAALKKNPGMLPPASQDAAANLTGAMCDLIAAEL